MKKLTFLITGVCWLLFGLGVGLFLVQHLVQDAGLPFFMAVSSGTVLVGMVQVIGLALASGLCFVIGLGLCAHSLVSGPESEASPK